MLTSSAKSKGRNLQKHVCERILAYFPVLLPGDVTSRSMGAQGTDVILSPRAGELCPIAIEAKSHARYALYKDYKQAESNAGQLQPILVIKQNNSKPLAIMDLEFFLKLMKGKP